MDAVISYVNCNDKIWRAEYDKYCTDFETKKYFFYDWGTLKYVLRGISVYMPYIKNVFLIVSNIEQVPDYVDQSKVKIVLHKDFIPEEYLPTFNSCTIETFMNDIEGLDEQFIYFNDDMIPIAPISYGDLFCNGKPCISFESNPYPPERAAYHTVKLCFLGACLHTSYKKTYSRNIISDPLLYEGDGVCPVHGPCVFLKSRNMEMFKLSKRFFKRFITRERSGQNVSQWAYADIYYIEDNCVGSRLTLSYMRTTNLDAENSKNYILSQNSNYLCINDAGPIPGLSYEDSVKLVQECLEIKLPRKGIYEI